MSAPASTSDTVLVSEPVPHVLVDSHFSTYVWPNSPVNSIGFLERSIDPPVPSSIVHVPVLMSEIPESLRLVVFTIVVSFPADTTGAAVHKISSPSSLQRLISKDVKAKII